MGSRVDWEAVRARLAATERTVGRNTIGDRAREAIFARRAEAVARPPEAAASGDMFEALVFRLGEERYALPSRQVVEVRPLGQLTPLPGMPALVAGLLNVRGRIVPVLDLRPLFGLPAAAAGVAQSVLLVSCVSGNVGLLATDRPEVRALAGGELGGLPAGAPSGLDPAYVRGVTEDLIVVLDAERLLVDPRLIVHEETR